MNVETVERKLATINEGKLSEIAYQHFHGIIEKAKADLIRKLTGEYRSGKIEAVMMASRISALCELEDLDQRIKSAIVKGRSTEGGFLKDGHVANEPG